MCAHGLTDGRVTYGVTVVSGILSARLLICLTVKNPIMPVIPITNLIPISNLIPGATTKAPETKEQPPTPTGLEPIVEPVAARPANVGKRGGRAKRK